MRPLTEETLHAIRRRVYLSQQSEDARMLLEVADEWDEQAEDCELEEAGRSRRLAAASQHLLAAVDLFLRAEGLDVVTTIGRVRR